VSIKLASHLKRNRFGVFYFRQVVPPDLRKFFAFKEFSRSTKTSRRGEAAALARNCGACLALLFERLRQMAKDKNPVVYELGYITKIELHENGSLKSIFTDTDPGEEAAALGFAPNSSKWPKRADRQS